MLLTLSIEDGDCVAITDSDDPTFNGVGLYQPCLKEQPQHNKLAKYEHERYINSEVSSVLSIAR